MDIHVNGEIQAMKDGSSLLDLLTELGFTEGRIAVEVNQSIIPRSEHANHLLHPDDRVEIVHAIGGG